MSVHCVAPLSICLPVTCHGGGGKVGRPTTATLWKHTDWTRVSICYKPSTAPPQPRRPKNAMRSEALAFPIRRSTRRNLSQLLPRLPGCPNVKHSKLTHQPSTYDLFNAERDHLQDPSIPTSATSVVFFSVFLGPHPPVPSRALVDQKSRPTGRAEEGPCSPHCCRKGLMRGWAVVDPVALCQFEKVASGSGCSPVRSPLFSRLHSPSSDH